MYNVWITCVNNFCLLPQSSLLEVLVLDIRDVEGLICNLYMVYIQGDEWIGQRGTEASGTKNPLS